MITVASLVVLFYLTIYYLDSLDSARKIALICEKILQTYFISYYMHARFSFREISKQVRNQKIVMHLPRLLQLFPPLYSSSSAACMPATRLSMYIGHMSFPS